MAKWVENKTGKIIDAVMYTGDNLDFIRKCFNDTFGIYTSDGDLKTTIRIRFSLDKGDPENTIKDYQHDAVVCKPGEYLCKEDGCYSVCSEETFRSLYTAYKE